MANPEGYSAPRPEIIERIRAVLPDFTRLDGSVNANGMSSAIGINRETTRRYLKLIKDQERQDAQVDYTPDIDGIPEAKPRVRVRAYNLSVTADLPVRRVVAIGDMHITRGMDSRHMKWIGWHVTVPKIGVNNAITVTNVGSAMPHGYVAKYAEGATTGISYGIADMRLRGGRVESVNFISMLELKERYGD